MTKKWEIEGFLEDRQGVLHIDGHSTHEIAKTHGTPVFVFSKNRIRHNINRLLKIQDVIDCKLKVCYAAKANSEGAVLEAVKDSGIDIEVNSGGELRMVLAAGFTGNQIIFNGNSKTEKELEDAINAGIYAIQSDSFYELELTEKVARRLGKRANVSLRLVPDIQSETLHGLQTALVTSKFGMMPEEALEAFKRWSPDNKHMNLCGIHIHIGSQNPSAVPYQDALLNLFIHLREINAKTSHKIGHINIGGGFPVNYMRDDSHAEFMCEDQVALLSTELVPSEIVGNAWTAVMAVAEESGSRHLLENIELLIEPGRCVIGDAAVCLTTVRNKKSRPGVEGLISGIKTKISKPETNKPESGSAESGPPDTISELQAPNRVTWLLTDAGFNILLSMETYKWYYHLIHSTRADAPHDFPYKVAGPLCDGGDVYFDIEGKKRLPEYRFLPENIVPGEVLALLNTGAYSVAQMFPYNGRELPGVLVV